MSSDLLVAVIAAAEETQMQRFKERMQSFNMTAADKSLESSMLRDEPHLCKAWLAAHAEQIMERRHKEFFQSAAGVSMTHNMTAESMMNAFVQHRVKKGAELGEFLCDGNFHIKARFCLRTEEQDITSYLSIAEGENSLGNAETAASYLFAHPEGLQLAARYYQEVYGLTASVEHSAPPAKAWDIVFQLGKFDEPASNARIQAGCTKIAKAAFFGGQKGRRAVQELRVVWASLARHIGKITESPELSGRAAILIGSWLSVASMLSAMAFTKR